MTYSNADAFSRLIKIEGSWGTTNLPPVTLEWREASTNDIQRNTFTINEDFHIVTLPNFTHVGFISEDLNSDGLTDIISCFYPNNASINNGRGEGVIFLNKGNNEYRSNGSYTLGLNCKDDPFTYKSQNCIADFMGDGNKELVIPIINGKNQMQLFLPQTSSGTSHQLSLSSSEMPAYAIGCLYNNGKDCFVLIDKGKNTQNNGHGMNITYKNDMGIIQWCSCYIPLPQSPKKIFIADYNADGVKDLLVLRESGYTIFWNKGVAEGNMPFSNDSKTAGRNLKDTWIVQPGDFNGDGLTDFVSNQTNDDNWNFYLNNGNGTFAEKTAIVMEGVHDCTFTDRDDNRLACHVLDFNCDGKDDIVITWAKYKKKGVLSEYGDFQKTYTYWLTSDGSSLSLVKTASSNKDSDALNGYFMTGDFSGDGLIELVNYGYNCYGSTNSNTSPSWNLYKNSKSNTNSNKITKVKNGTVGTTTSISYSTLCDADVYSKGKNCVYPLIELQVPLSVVKTVSQNIAYNSYTTNYLYKGLRAHLRGRGLLGFTTIEANNTTTGEKRSTTVKSLNDTYYEPSKITSTITLGGKTSTTETTMKVVPYYGKCHFTYPQTIKQTDFYGDVITTTNDYSNGYYLTKQHTEYGGPNMYKEVVYSSFRKVGGVSKPQKVKTTQKHSDDASAFSQETIYEYANNGTITKMVENAPTEESDTHPVTHEYTYYPLGNLKTHTVSASSITTVTTSFTYDGTNRYVTSENSSANSLVANYTYDKLGRLTKKQEGLRDSFQTTNYSYDAVGNITKITYPDSTITTYTRSWGTNGYKAYKVTATTTAQAPVTTWYDNIGREVISSTSGEKGISLTTSTNYNAQNGKVSMQSKSIGNISLTDTYTYNTLGQITKLVSSAGQTINYSHSKRSVTETQANNKYLQRCYDAWGNLSSVSHNYCSSASYKYCSNGQPKTISYGDASSQNYTVATMAYDSSGLQTSLIDVDAGKTTFEYDALGRVIKQTDARGNVTTNTYNASGLLVEQTCGGVTTIYTYNSRLLLTNETSGNQSIEYVYDTHNRLTKKTYTIDGTCLSYLYVYNTTGQMASQTFPDGMTENYTYDSYGNLTTIKINGQRVWELKSYTGTQRVAYLGTAPLTLTTSYGVNGLPEGSVVKKGSSTLHSFGYTFDGATSNLKSRTGMQSGTESFTYDSFDRLTTGTSYFINGNINSKTGIGNYTYDTNKKHAVVQVQNSSNLIQGAANITYNAFNKVSTVTQGSNKLTITYGPNRQRVKTVLVGGSTTTTTLYADNYEQRTAGGVTTSYHYVASPDGLIAVYVKKNGTTTPYYVETDHLGSIVNLYDANGTKQFSATYDAWGKQTITKNAIGLTRGYTGHEHWNQFGLIDMNGRFYDPLIGRFLSPDPYVQAPDNPQNFNRYSYCLNNPLKYTDPTGEWILTWGISNSGFSIGLNFAPYPFGCGINVDWSNGFSLGVYGEVGYRAGGTCLGTGIYADQGFSYNFKHNEWSTFASEGTYASVGPFTAGGSVNQNYNITNDVFCNDLSVNIGLGWGGNNYGYSFGANYTFGDNGGWSWSFGGNYVYEKPTHEKEFVQHIDGDGTIEFGNVTANDYNNLPDDQKSRYKTNIIDNPSVEVDDPLVSFKLHKDCKKITELVVNENTTVGVGPNNSYTFSNQNGLYIPKSTVIIGIKQVGTITHKQLMRMHRHHNFNHHRFHK